MQMKAEERRKSIEYAMDKVRRDCDQGAESNIS